MEQEDFSRSELLKELETLRQQIVAYHLSSDLFEDDPASLSLKNINFEQIFQNLPVGIVVLDKSGRVLTSNSIIRDYFELDAEMMRNKLVSEAVYLFRMPDAANDLQNLLRKNTRFDIETPLIVSHSGIPLFLRCRGMSLDKGSSSESQYVLLFSDITKLRLTQDSLRRNDEMYRDLVEGLDEIAFSIDLDGTIVFVNSAVERLLGHKVPEITGRSFAEFFSPEDLKEALKIFSRILSGNSFHGKCRIRSANNEFRWMSISSQPLIQTERIRGVSGLLQPLDRLRKVEKAIRNGDADYQNLFEISSDAIFIIEDGLINKFNPQALKLFRCEAGQILNHALYHFSPAHQPDGCESRSTLRGRMEKCRPGDQQFFEWTFLRFDGKPFFSEVNFSRGGQGERAPLLAIIRDITERKITEDKLRDAHLRVLMVLDSLDAAVFVRDFRNHENLFTNRMVREQAAYFLNDDFIGGLSSGLSRREAGLPNTGEDYFARGFSSFELEHPFDGRWYQIRDRVIRWVDGRMVRLAVAMDITDRKLAELKLQESEERLRTLINATPDIICFKDGEGRWLEANIAFLELFGLLSFDYRGMTNAQVASENEFLSELFQRWERNEEKIWQSKLSFRANEIILRKEQPARIFDVIRLPLFYSDGKRKGLVILGRDITEQKQLEEQLRQAQKMEAIGRLAGGVAHDFNNLLTIIQGYSEILIGMIEEDNPLFKGIKQIRSAASKAESLTDQLLAFSRRQVIQPKIINLITLLHEIEPMLRRLIGEDIELQIIHPEMIANIKCDAHQMEQVIMNIVVNARDAMPEGGILKIETREIMKNDISIHTKGALEHLRYILLKISDTGIGMDRDTQTKIFEPFFTTKDKGQGTGLGLATVYGIVLQNNGHIQVQSSPGKGSEFEIFIPAVDEGITITGDRNLVYDELKGTETILVVEDEGDVRQLIRDVLKSYGYNVLDAANGRDAIQTCRNSVNEVSLLLTDVVMPHMSGRELIEQLLVFNPGIKVVFMSGYTDATIANKGVLKSGTHFLQKPFSPNKLAQKIRQILDTH